LFDDKHFAVKIVADVFRPPFDANFGDDAFVFPGSERREIINRNVNLDFRVRQIQKKVIAAVNALPVAFGAIRERRANRRKSNLAAGKRIKLRFADCKNLSAQAVNRKI
jgi:hypothetical protein